MSILKSYLRDRGIKQADFAEQLGVQQGTVSRLVNGDLRPSLPLAFAIERATDGAVPASAWVPSEARGAA